MPIFGDTEGRTIVPEGNYIFCVVDFEIGISKGSKTGGSEAYNVVFELETQNGRSANVYEILIDHPSTIWKLDTFLKCAGIKLKKGEAYEFREDEAARQKCRFIDVKGLRGHCAVTVEEYQDPKSKQTRKKNRIVTFYTNKEKLPRREIEEPASAPEAAEDDVPF